MESRSVSFFVLVGLVFVLFQTSISAEVLSIAHRGNSLFAPENTLAAFTAAHGKADLIESDVHVSSDGKLVILHDGTVDRTTDGTGAVSGKTLAALKALDAGSWFATNFVGERIPTFEEMIENILPHAIPLIERKAGPASAYVSELQRLGVTTNVVVQAFDWNFLAAVHALDPDIPLCALGSGTFSASTLASIASTGARTVAWEKSSVTPEVLSKVHNGGMRLFVWTVDGVQIQNFLDMGVDGIISNDPGKVKEFQEPPTGNTGYIGDGLVAYWKMDDGLVDPWTTIVSDSKGTNSGSLLRTDGLSHWLGSSAAKFDGSLSVDGTNASVAFPQTAALDINTNQLTISTWVRLQTLPSKSAASFGAIFDSTNDAYVLYLDRSAKELRFKITDANGHAARPGIPEAFLATNEWLHVAATFSGSFGPASGQATIYLNGHARDVHTGNDGGSPIGLTGNIKPGQLANIGRDGSTSANYFSGTIDDLAIWKRALKSEEIKNLFEGGTNGLSLEALMSQPTPLIQLVSARNLAATGSLEIRFKNLGTWQEFRLWRAASLDEPFEELSEISPEALGNNELRFSYPWSSDAGFFRIEGR